MKHYKIFSGLDESQNLVLRSRYNVMSRAYQNGDDISCIRVMSKATVKKILQDPRYVCVTREKKVGRKIVYRSITICPNYGECGYNTRGL